jgi:hypothetical protein
MSIFCGALFVLCCLVHAGTDRRFYSPVPHPHRRWLHRFTPVVAALAIAGCFVQKLQW